MSDADFEFEFLRVHRDGPVLHARLDRPEKLNAFAGSVRDDLRAVFDTADTDSSVGCLVLSGSGRAFCAGGDVGVMERLRREGDSDGFTAILDAANGAAAALRRCRVPTIALVQGPAAGGGANLALGCDIRLGSREAAFTQSFVHLGLAPDWGGSRILVDIVGADRARELLLSGRTVGSDEALTLGLLHRLVDDPDALEAEGSTLARTLAARSSTALAAIGALIDAADRAVPYDEQLALEKRWQLECFDSAEADRAFAAFLARRRR